ILSSKVAACCAKLSKMTATVTVQADRVWAIMAAEDASSFVEKRIKELGLSVRKVANMAGISHTHLGNLIKGVASWKEVQLSTLEGLAYALDVPVSDLIALARGKELIPRPKPQERVTQTRYILQTVLGLASAGQPVDYGVPVLADVWRRGSLLYRVEGDSMAPTLQEGDRVYVDPRDTDLHEGKIYVFELPSDGHIIKRVRRLDDGQLWLVSDNPRYRPMRPDECIVVGRVYYYDPVGGRL
ncbi:MAG TPA: S24 family peptidase, partial [Meiothermus sp.]|nr:S24 family peptidase [Meiothermus sp.]